MKNQKLVRRLVPKVGDEIRINVKPGLTEKEEFNGLVACTKEETLSRKIVGVYTDGTVKDSSGETWAVYPKDGHWLPKVNQRTYYRA